MTDINLIKEPISKELKEFEKYYKDSLKGENFLLKAITEHIYRRKGKQLRPSFVLLSAKLNGEITDKTYAGATLIELLHSATLIHDDVVDNSNYRRGFLSLKALWGSKIAVLVGDYLLSKGLLLSIDTDNVDLLKITSEAVKEMAEGELLQIEKNRKKSITEDEYIEIISKKTAALLGASGAIGAKSVGCSDETVDKMKSFGIYIGLAFQIKDDILDISQAAKTGKTFGNDIREGKKTLPYIKAYESCKSRSEIRRTKKILAKKDKDEEDIKEILEFINKYHGIEQAYKTMYEFKSRALSILDSYNDTEIKKAMTAFIDYTIERKK